MKNRAGDSLVLGGVILVAKLPDEAFALWPNIGTN